MTLLIGITVFWNRLLIPIVIWLGIGITYISYMESLRLYDGIIYWKNTFTSSYRNTSKENLHALLSQCKPFTFHLEFIYFSDISL